MDRQVAIEMLARYRAGHCTEDERQLIERWILYGAADPLDLSDAQLLEDLLDIRLRLEHDLHQKTPVKTLGFQRWLPYVAAVLVIGSIGTWALWDSPIINQKNEQESATVADIQPGGNRALLTLADGRTIDLSTAQSEIVVGNEITYSDGTAVLSPKAAAAESRPPTSEAGLLTLSTPKGGTYQITLPDGSKVWLNSASKLTYPSRFDKNERVVEMEGEAYFEVSKTPIKLPFLVKTRSQTVEVLGTQFNISAYGDEPEVKTTLVEGSVKVALLNNNRDKSNPRLSGPAPSTILKPGQQSIVRNEKATVNEVDVSAFIGWKEGFFIFSGTELRDAMRQISRWYDVEIVYEGNMPRTPFYGKISRDDTLAEVLAILKEGKVNFRIEKDGANNRLIVMP